MAYRLSYSDYPLPAAPLAPPVAPPTPESIPGGPGFSGNPQPPDVPCDPTGDGWRGPPGPTGPQGTTALIQVQDTPPANPLPGQLWFDSSNPQLYVVVCRPNLGAVGDRHCLCRWPDDRRTERRADVWAAKRGVEQYRSGWAVSVACHRRHGDWPYHIPRRRDRREHRTIVCSVF